MKRNGAKRNGHGLQRGKAMALAGAVLAGVSSAARGQIASLDNGHRILVNNGLQIWGVDTDTSYGFDYNTMAAANMNAVMWGFPAAGGTDMTKLSTGNKWAKWTDYNGSPSTALTASEQTHASDLIALSVGDEQDLNTVNSGPYTATVNWFQNRNANNYQYFPDTLCFVNHFYFIDSAFSQFVASANPDAISFDSYPFSNPDGHYITSYNWLSLAQQVRREALGSYVGATNNAPRPYGLYVQTYHDTYAIDPGEAEIRWQQFAAWTMGYTFVDAFIYSGGNTNFYTQPPLYYQYRE